MANSTIPEASNFPKGLNPVISPPSTSRIANVVLFFPGLGDTSVNFSSFAKALNLPESLCITLQPLMPLPQPLDPGYHWGDDIIFDQSTGMLDHDAGFATATRVICDDVVNGILVQQCGFKHRDVLFLGYGQGGMAALAAALFIKDRLAGVISIGGSLPLSTNSVNTQMSKTPVLLLGGGQGEIFRNDRAGVKKVQSSFEFVESHQWKKKDDSMPKNRDEALPMMQFLARQLRSLHGVPKDAVEVG